MNHLNKIAHLDKPLKKTIFLSLLFFCIQMNAQIKQDTIVSKNKSNDYYESTVDQINIKLDLDSNSERFDLVGQNFEYDIRPNVSTLARISINYKFLSFSFTYPPKIIPGNDDDALKGKTKGFGLGLNLNFNKWIQELQYSKVKGFYLENSDEYVSPWIQGTTPYIQFPDLKVISFRGATSYKFNSNYSLKAISTQTEIQLKSAGSFIPSLIYSYYIIDNQSNSAAQKTSQKSNSFEALINIGYYYTFVLHKNWYTSLGVSQSAGLNYTSLLTRLPQANVKTNYTTGVVRINGKAGIGYNSKRYFGGIELNAFKAYRNEDSPTVTLATTNTAFQIFFGYRFKPPKSVQNIMNEIEEKKPF